MLGQKHIQCHLASYGRRAEATNTVSPRSSNRIEERTYSRNGISIQVDVPTRELHTVHTNGRDKAVGNDLRDRASKSNDSNDEPHLDFRSSRCGVGADSALQDRLLSISCLSSEIPLGLGCDPGN